MSNSPVKYVILLIVVFGLFVLVSWYRKRKTATSEKPAYVSLEVNPSQAEAQSQPTFSELSDADQARLDSQRQIVVSALKQRYGVSTLRKDKTDLTLLQRLLDDKVFSPTQTIELQSMGVVFGDVLASKLGLRWIMITDEYGTDPTLQIPGTQFIFNALTMISKRVEQGRAVNVDWLFRVIEEESKRIRKDMQTKDN